MKQMTLARSQRRWNIPVMLLMILSILPFSLLNVPAVSAASDCTFFPETQHSLCGGFKSYWEKYGGLAVFGYPVTDEFREDGYTVQYLERARYEWHPGAWPERFDVELGLLGDVAAEDTYGANYASTLASFKPAVKDTASGCQYYAETQHNICGGFASYFNEYGGLAVYGFPISEAFTVNGLTVQYFERQRFEWHPGAWPERFDVELGLVGTASAAAFTQGSTPLDVPYTDQFASGLWTVNRQRVNHDCGPASVAMVVDYYHAVPSGMSTPSTQLSNGIPVDRNGWAALIDDARSKMGIAAPNEVGIPDIATSLKKYGLDTSILNRTDSSDKDLANIEAAVDQGHPVIVLIDANDFQRPYNGHFVVVVGHAGTGSNAVIYANDADLIPGRTWISWNQGGKNVTFTSDKFKQAIRDANSDQEAVVVSSGTPGTPPQSAPATPTNVQASPVNSTSIRVTWEYTGSDETGFKIFLNGGTPANQPASNRSVMMTGLKPNTRYCFEVQAFNGDVPSGSAESCATTFKTAIADPTNVRATALSSSSIKVTWDKYSGDFASGIRVYTNNGTPVTFGASETTTTFNGLQPNTKYCFEVQALLGDGDASKLVEACATTFQAVQPPADVTNVQASTPSSTQIVVTWQYSGPPVDGFYVSNGDTTQTVNDANARQFVWNGLPPGKYQCNLIKAFNKAGSSPDWSNQACVTTPQASPPPAQPAAPLGGIDIHDYCQSLGYDGYTLASNDAYGYRCSGGGGDFNSDVQVNMDDACAWQYNRSDVLSRFTDFHDTTSWRCFGYSAILGGVNFDGYCQSLGYDGSTVTENDAYGVACETGDEGSVGISVGAACLWQYHNPTAIERVINFYDPNGWQCFASKP